MREKQVYAELIPWDRADDVLPALQPKGIILSGGPNSVYDDGRADPAGERAGHGRAGAGHLLWPAVAGPHAGRPGHPVA